MSLIVQKFGGSSVRDAQRIRNVAGIIADTYRAGNQVMVVLSAQGDTTDDLIEKAREINPRASKREMDMLLSTGEQISIALCAMALEGMGLPVVSLAAWQVGIQTTSAYSDARIKKIDPERIQRELDKNKIVLVAGFQGVNRFGDVTTLGRGGSDTSAVALAAAFGADLCQIYTDVDGVYTTDPRVTSGAVKLEEITYDEMLELASQGAQVLHNRSVELAKKYHVNMEVVSSLERKPGTKVKEVVKMEKTNIAGVAKDTSIARIAVVGLDHNPGVAFRVFSLLGKAGINVDAIIQSIGRDTSKDISFTLPRADVEEAVRVLEDQKGALHFDHLTVEDKIAKVSIVGAGMMTTPGVAAKMFEALYDANINIQMINTSEIRVSVLIDEEDAVAAVRAVHDKFFGDDSFS
ncbi:MAG: aspartate kinase [Oscillospiraceae bacterium]|nr:aspartate kinase [Oscillospiraceae bacterium]